jgi:hypothetical protein
MLKSQLADAREAAISSSEQHAQPKHHETQKTKKNNEMFIVRWRTGTRDV